MKSILLFAALLLSAEVYAAAPVATNDTRPTPSNTAVTFSISANDTDADGNGTLSLATIDLDPATSGRQTTRVVNGQGTYSVDDAGNLTFTPGSNYTGTSTVSYTVQDNTALVSNVATVTINVGPLAVVDAATTARNLPATVNVLDNDTDVNGLAAATLDLNPSVAGRQTTFAVTGGSFACDNAGNVTFTPSSPYSVGLTAVVSYVVDDATGATSNPTTLTVTTVNVPPSAVADVAYTPSNTAITFSISANDSDADGTLVLTTLDVDPIAAGRQFTRTVSGQGVYTVDNLGNLTFTPNTNYTGSSSLTYNVQDNDNTVSNSATVTVNVGPLAVSDAAATTPTASVAVNVLTNDNDVNGLAVATVDLDPGTAGRQTTRTVAGQGTFTVDNSGNITFVPSSGYVGSTATNYTVQDQTGATSNATTFTVTTSNSTPLAVNDVVLTASNTAVVAAVTANDVDPGGNLNASTVDLDPATAGLQTSFTASGQGTFTTVGQPVGSVRFTPASNFTGTGAVSYTVQNVSGTTSNTATLSVRVGPLAVLDAANVSSSAPTTFNILANDSDVDGLAVNSIDLDPATAGQQSAITVANRGTFSLDPATGLITFTPSTPYTAGLVATISYMVRDNFGAPSNPVNLTVTTTNTAPVANADVANATPGQTLIFSVTANDTDADGTVNLASVDLDPAATGRQTTFAYIVGGVTLGTFTTSGTTGNVQWAPTGGAASTYTGTATISYIVLDNTGVSSNSASITLRVGPRALADAATTLPNTSVAVDLLANDVDEDGIDITSVDLDPATAGTQASYSVTGQGAYAVDNTGSVTFTPEPGYIGTSTLSYTVRDLIGATSSVGTLTVTVVTPNVVPVAQDDDVQTTPATSVTFSVTANDTDSDGTLVLNTLDLDPATTGRQTTLSLSGVGTFTADNAGNVTFVPVAGYTNTAVTTYTIDDNSGGTSNIASIDVRVGPLAVADAFNVLPGSSASLNVLTNDTDANGIDATSVDLDPATTGIQTTLSVAAGAYSVDASGTVTFTPVTGYTNTSISSYTVLDATGAVSSVGTLTARVGPQTTDDAATTFQNVAVVFNVTTNDTDANGLAVNSVDLDPTTAGRQTTFTVAGQGTYAVSSTGNVTFTPVAAFVGTSSVGYTVNDATGAPSTVGNFAVTVILNQAPIAVADDAQTPPNTTVYIPVTANDSDPDGTIDGTTIDLDPATNGTQTSRAVTGQGTFTTVGQPAGTVRFIPSTNYTGTSTINYWVRDAIGGLSNISTLTVRVGPRAISNTTQTLPGVAVSVNAPGNDVDANGLDLTTVDLDPATPGLQQSNVVVGLGTFSLNATTGVVTFTPSSPTATGTATITYTINDQTAATSNVATITVNITDDGAPIAVDDEAFTPYLTAITFNLTNNDIQPTGGSIINTASIDLDPNTAGQQTTFTVSGEGIFTTVGVTAGSVRFTPATGFTGNTVIAYTVNDNRVTPGPRTSDPAAITVHVGPQAVNDAASGPRNVPTVVAILANDVDVDGIDEATVDLNTGTGRQTSFSVTNRGTFAVDAAGVVTFTPAATIPAGVSTATLAYTVLDNTGAISGASPLYGTLTFTILAASAPVAVNDLRTTPSNTPITFSITANDTDADGNATIDPSTVDLDPATPGQQTTLTVAGRGDFVVDNLGNLTYTPISNYTSVTTIGYTVQDNTGYTSNPAFPASSGIISINVGPNAQNDASSVRYNLNRNFTVTANDIDSQGLRGTTLDLDPLTAGRQISKAAFIGATQVGTFTANDSGVITFTALAGANTLGVTTVNYVLTDNAGALSATYPGPALSNVATYSLTLTSAVPVAVADTRRVVPNAATSFNVTTNDTDADGNTTINVASVDLDPNTAGIQNSLTVAGQGAFTVSALGVVTFTPLTGFTGSTIIPYTVNDAAGVTSNQANIRVDLGPITANDAAFVLPNTARNISVLANDVDVSGFNANSVDVDLTLTGRQTSRVISGQGTFSVGTTGVVRFTPASNYTGTSSTTYIVYDVTNAPSLVATVSVVVGPRAIADAVSYAYNVSPTFSITANDLDVDGLDLTSVDLNPAVAGRQTTYSVSGRGTFTADNAGNVTFVPVSGYLAGTTTFTYTLLDALGAISNAGTVTLTTTNATPVANNDVAVTPPNTSVSFNITANDTDNESTINNATTDLNPAVTGRQTTLTVTGQGVFTLSGANNGLITFAPAANFTGSSSITYTVQDATTRVSNAATITVNVGPLTVGDGASRASNAAVSVSVLNNDTDVNGLDAATVDLDPTTAGRQTTMAGTGGTFTVSTAGVVTFTPIAPFTGGLVSTVTYTVNDVTGAPSSVATLIVTSTNTPPTANADDTQTPANTSVSLNVTTNDVDPDGAIDVASVDLNPATAPRETSRTIFGEGSWTVDNAGLVTFTPVLNYTGTATLQYLVNDNSGQTSTTAGTITVRVGPLTVNDAATTPSNTAVTLNLVGNDIDSNGLDLTTIDLDPATAGRQTTRTIIVGGVTYGTFTLPGSNNGTVTFTPAAPFASGRVSSINYVLLDATGAISTIATITVTTQNVAPTAVADDVAMRPNGTITFNVLANDSDPEAALAGNTLDLDPSTVARDATRTVNGEGTYSVDNAGNVTFTPFTNFTDTSTITYVVQDAAGASSNPVTITVRVGPLTVADAATTPVGSSISTNVLANDTDVNGLDPGTLDLDPSTPGQQLSFTVARGTFTVDAAMNGIVNFVPSLPYTSNMSAVVTCGLFDLTGAPSLLAIYTVTTPAPLPVELMAFAAKAVRKVDAQLSWRTASEKDNDHFDIERSLTGRAFEKLAAVQGQGSKPSPTDYAFTDAGIGRLVAGTVYYRLKQVDFDGNSSYSPVQTVAFADSTPLAIGLYPSPAGSAATLDLRQLPTGTYQVLVLDATGRTVLSPALEAGRTHTLDLRQLATGTYLVRVQGAAGSFTLRLMKN
jgi:CshA-type fibril repeat protein